MNCKAILLASAIGIAADAAGAAEVYRWTDADGVVHYSDTEPDGREAETLVVRATTPPDYRPEDDPYSILNQAARLKAAREKLEEERQARDQQREIEYEQRPQYAEEPAIEYSTWYGPGYYHRPVRPIVRPGQQRRVLRQQARALEETGLTAPRPSSINSGVHARRVQQSQALPLAGGRPTPRR